MNFLRNTAYHVRISDIYLGKYMKGEAGNYIELNNSKISRVNIIGVLVSKQDKTAAIDDSSSTIRLFEFDTNFLEKHNVGDIVLVVGRIREANSERYIVPEIIKKIDKKWLFARAKKFGVRQKIAQEEAEEISKEKNEEFTATEDVDKDDEKENKNETILNYIRKNDKGGGVEIDLIISDLNSTEEKVQELLKSGEIFIIKPGAVKVLE